MSNRMATIQEPITGREDLGDLTQPHQALAQFYKALNARDLALMEQNWDGSPEAAMDNPLVASSAGGRTYAKSMSGCSTRLGPMRSNSGTTRCIRRATCFG